MPLTYKISQTTTTRKVPQERTVVVLSSFRDFLDPSSGADAEHFRNRVRFHLRGKPVAYFQYFEEKFFNPITGKFDWLAEDASGTFYSPNMPNSALMASPPIRVVNIRCPLTASDPPFFEDFTKW